MRRDAVPGSVCVCIPGHGPYRSLARLRARVGDYAASYEIFQLGPLGWLCCCRWGLRWVGVGRRGVRVLHFLSAGGVTCAAVVFGGIGGGGVVGGFGKGVCIWCSRVAEFAVQPRLSSPSVVFAALSVFAFAACRLRRPAFGRFLRWCWRCSWWWACRLGGWFSGGFRGG